MIQPSSRSHSSGTPHLSPPLVYAHAACPTPGPRAAQPPWAAKWGSMIPPSSRSHSSGTPHLSPLLVYAQAACTAHRTESSVSAIGPRASFSRPPASLPPATRPAWCPPGPPPPRRGPSRAYPPLGPALASPATPRLSPP